MVLRAGQQVGSYRILEEIANGAYASVYKASHVILADRLVALKVLHTRFLDSKEGTELFFQEARLLEQLKHPHILAILDANLYEGMPYIVKEFAAHGSLRNLLQRQRSHVLPLQTSLAILRQAGEALSFVHQHKIVHCDLKPENILFNANDDALLADFDISRVLHGANTAGSGLGGSLSYMAPEQFQGKVRFESDQYALACIAYELFTGRRPFVGADLEALKHAHLSEPPVPLTHYNAALPLHMEQAVLKALEKKYSDRFENIAAFLDALDPPVVSSRSIEWAAMQSGPRLILKDAQGNSSAPDDIYYEATVVGPPEAAHAAPRRSSAKRSVPEKTASSSHVRTSTARKHSEEEHSGESAASASAGTTRKRRSTAATSAATTSAKKKTAAAQPAKESTGAEKKRRATPAATSKEDSVHPGSAPRKRTTTKTEADELPVKPRAKAATRVKTSSKKEPADPTPRAHRSQHAQGAADQVSQTATLKKFIENAKHTSGQSATPTSEHASQGKKTKGS